MKKNIFESNAKNELLQRVEKLATSSKGLWGSMTVEEMLHHCRIALRKVLDAAPSDKKSTFRQKLIKFYFLYLGKEFPKNVRTPKQFDVKQKKPEVADFSPEKDQLIKVVNEFAPGKELNAVHPYFGRLTTTEWGVFTWMHLDHHLRQFGV